MEVGSFYLFPPCPSPPLLHYILPFPFSCTQPCVCAHLSVATSLRLDFSITQTLRSWWMEWVVTSGLWLCGSECPSFRTGWDCVSATPSASRTWPHFMHWAHLLAGALALSDRLGSWRSLRLHDSLRVLTVRNGGIRTQTQLLCLQSLCSFCHIKGRCISPACWWSTVPGSLWISAYASCSQCVFYEPADFDQLWMHHTVFSKNLMLWFVPRLFLRRVQFQSCKDHFCVKCLVLFYLDMPLLGGDSEPCILGIYR